MKQLTFILFLLWGILANAQDPYAGLYKSWKIVKYETFGVSAEPTEKQKKDQLTFNVDKSFVIVENGGTYKGGWKINSGYIVCTSLDKKFSRTYKIIEML